MSAFLLFLFIILSMISALSLGVFFTAKFLVRVAMDRVLPRSVRIKDRLLNRITGSDEFVDTLRAEGELLEAEETETVEIFGRDGVRLVGHFLHVASPVRIVIAVHGWRGSWSRDFGMVCEYWRECDTTVLYIEQRGQKGSDGECITFGVLERYDILEWIKFVEKRNAEGLPIYLCGISMGASSVLMSSGLGLPRSVHGIIADSGFTTPDEIWSHVVGRMIHLPYTLYRGIADRECRRRIGCSARSCSTLTALKKCTKPVLFIHGTEDTFVPIKMTFKNYLAYGGEKRLFVVPGANHCMSYFIDKRGYEREMTDFFHKYD